MNRVLVASFLLAAACGDNNAPTGPDATVATNSGFTAGPHASAPRLESNGGPTLANPKILPIFYTGDTTMQAQIESFLGMLAGSSYWTATTTEYGVGGLTILPTHVEATAAPTTDAALQTFLANAIANQTLPYDPETIYAVYLPTANFDAGFGKACQSFGAYHDEAAGTSQQKIVYALMPRCQGGIDTLTDSSSHEFVEAATDPYVQTTGAFGAVDPIHAAWGIVPGAEAGDFCEYVDAAYQRLVGNFSVQRSWSNVAAAEGHDPCVPAPTPTDMPYMGATPKLLDSTFFPLAGEYTDATTIAMGTTKTIDIQLFTDAPTTTPLNIDVFDVFSQFGGGSGSTPSLTFTWDKKTGNNGDTLHLAITRNANGDSFVGGNLLGFTISQGSQPFTTGQWWAFVSN